MVALWAWFKGRWLRYVTRRGVRGRGSPGPVRALAFHARDSQGLLTSPHFQAACSCSGLEVYYMYSELNVLRTVAEEEYVPPNLNPESLIR